MDYSFSTLNDKDFEILVCDLLSRREGVHVERFKSGKDLGVDGRFFLPEGKREIIIQCKHWLRSDIAALMGRLRVDELSKVRSLSPNRYILATSLPLSRVNKQAIAKLFSPYIVSEADVLGAEDLNDLLRRAPDIERAHYKLWLSSTAVLSQILHQGIVGRSADSLAEAQEMVRRYVRTASHDQAAERLKKLGVLIITGEPGIGKTTLAEQLCLESACEGYALLKINDDIKEAEQVFSPVDKQLFYFDDFLGRNYLEALSGHEGNAIVGFIKRVRRTAEKRFILTSRSQILNQGKVLIDNFENAKVGMSEVLLKVDEYSPLEKAKILYNHLWHSELSDDFLDALYENHRYHHVIKHPNFNPRLISFITDSERVDVPAAEYWGYVETSLQNPQGIWAHPYDAQTDVFGRALILLVAMNGREITEVKLRSAYERYIATAHLAGAGVRDFHVQLKYLTGSMLNRRVMKSCVTVDLFNPSVGDFILHRHAEDTVTNARALNSLRSTDALGAFVARSARTGDTMVSEVIGAFLAAAEKEGFGTYESQVLCQAAQEYVKRANPANARRVIGSLLKWVLESPAPQYFAGELQLLGHGLTLGLTTENAVEQYLETLLDRNFVDDEIEAISRLGRTLDGEMGTEWSEFVRQKAVELLSESIDEEVGTEDVLANLSPVYEYSGDDVSIGFDEDEALTNIRAYVERRLDELGAIPDKPAIDEVVGHVDLRWHLNELASEFERRRGDDDYEPLARSAPSQDREWVEIDALFERDR